MLAIDSSKFKVLLFGLNKLLMSSAVYVTPFVIIHLLNL